jgi:hypothetical protein
MQRGPSVNHFCLKVHNEGEPNSRHAAHIFYIRRRDKGQSRLFPRPLSTKEQHCDIAARRALV